MSRKFTEKTILFASPGRHYLGDGLCLIVSPDKQNRRWIHRYTNPMTGKVTEAGIGPHPVVTLEDARAKVLEHRRLVRSGVDPVQHRKAERQAGVTFKEASDGFFAQHQKHWTPGHQMDVRYMIDVHGKAITNIPLAKLTQDHVRNALKSLWATCPDTAHRTLAMWKRVLKHAGRYDMEYRLPKLRKNGEHHHASLDYTELPDFIRQLRMKQSISKSAIALEFLILTACRTGEVLNAKWDEINWDTNVWTIPAVRTKTRKPHRVPLSPTAINLLRSLTSDGSYIFTGRPTGRLRDGTQYHSGAALNVKAMYELMRSTSFTVHGFRSTFRNWGLEQTEFDFFLLEMCLSHQVGNAVTRAYLRGDALEKRRVIMEAWAEYIEPPPVEVKPALTLVRATA
jgi:integrase